MTARAAIRLTLAGTLVASLLATLPACAVRAAFAQDAPPAELSAAKLSEEFSDPLTTVPQLFLQDIYTPASYGVDGQANRVIARVIVPRVPKYSLFPFVQLVRPTFSLVTVPDGRGGTRTAFGDMQLLDLVVVPLPIRDLVVGLGPVFVFPTATDRLAGQSAWQVGPAFGAIYKGFPGWLLGCVIQDPISFAYTSGDRRPIGYLSLQPIVFRHLWRGLYVKSADASWVVDWRNDSAFTLPLSVGLGYVFLRPGTPPINVFVAGEWMAYRHDAPVAQQTTVRFGVTVGFPQWRPW